MWHLLIQNLIRRKGYNIIIASAVALAVATALLTVFVSHDVRKGVEQNQRLSGADLAIVPLGTKEKGHIYLTKGPPTQGSAPSDISGEIKEYPEIEAQTAQKYLGTLAVGDKTISLIGFEPKTDFVIQPWLSKKNLRISQLRMDQAILGSQAHPGKRSSDTLTIGSTQFTVFDRLLETGTSMDTSIFLPLEAESFQEPSWLLLQLTPGASPDIMTNKLQTNLPQIEVIARPEMLKTINDQLDGLLKGGGLGIVSLLVVVSCLLVMGAAFAIMIHERRREFGLLKAMGAKNAFVLRLIFSEAVALGGIGGVVGIILSMLGVILMSIGIIPSTLSETSAIGFVLLRMMLLVALAITVGVLSALYPALAAVRLEPYEAIRSGE